MARSIADADDPAKLVETYHLLREAILDGKQVIATYNGQVRLLCPYVLGTKAGRAQCLFYQFAGETSQGLIAPYSPDNWRCMRLEKLEDIQLHDGQWYGQTRGTSGSQTCIDTVDVSRADVAPDRLSG